MAATSDESEPSVDELASHELESPPWLRVESTLMAAARQIRIAYDQELAPVDLNLSQASLLAFVAEFGPKSQTYLASRLDLRRAATGTMIDSLERRGLVERQADADDRRVWLVAITPEGKDVVGRVLGIDAVVRAELRNGISREERQQLAGLISRLSANCTTLRARGSEIDATSVDTTTIETTP